MNIYKVIMKKIFLFLYNLFVSPKSPVNSIKSLKKSAEQGIAEAQIWAFVMKRE